MAEHGAESGEGLAVRKGTAGMQSDAEVAAKPDGGAALEDVEDEGGDAEAFPPVRSTLVAPMLPLPMERMSCLRKMRMSR